MARSGVIWVGMMLTLALCMTQSEPETTVVMIRRPWRIRNHFRHFDTLEHFQRVGAFRDAITPFMLGGEDDALPPL